MLPTYTNHTLRATATTVLHEEKYAPAAVQSVTGHKSFSSLAVYQQTSSDQKLEMAHSLHLRIAGTSQLQVFEPSRRRNSLHRESCTLLRVMSRHLGSCMSAVRGGRASSDIVTVDELNVIFDETNEPEAVPVSAPIFNNCQINTLNIVYKQ